MAAVLAAGLAAALNVGKVPVALPLLRAELGLTLVQAGWVSSMLTTLALLGAAFVGMWVGRVGALRMVLAGLALCTTASVAATAWPGWAPLMASRLVEGLGFMWVAVACPALITAASAPAQRRLALSFWSAYMPAGASIAMLASPLLLPATGWQGLWWLTAAVMALAAIGLWAQRQHFSAAAPAPTAGGSFLGPVKAALGHPLPWLLALSFGVWATQHFALIVWMPTYLQEQRGLGPGATALLTGVMLLACVPGNLVGGWLVQRGVQRGHLLLGGQLAAGLGAVVYSLDALPDPLRYAAAVWVSFAGGVIPAAIMSSSTVLARSPQQIGTLQGLYMQGAQLGQFVGTPLVAAVVASSGQWRSALWVTASAAVMGVALALAAGRLESRLAR
ncbi:MAG: MFS transporter [Rubrivivax sp.]|nr:MFS transporter [Rubrivivax sp.]